MELCIIDEMIRGEIVGAGGKRDGVSMNMQELKFIVATPEMLEEIWTMFSDAIAEMNRNNIPQWDEVYPAKEHLQEDIRKGEMCVVVLGAQIVAAYVVNQESDEAYRYAAWQAPESNYRVLHRLCVSPKFQHQGIAGRVMLYIENTLRQQGVESIRLDAFTQNPYALSLYKMLGYEKVGFADWRKGRFWLFEKIL